MSPSPRVDAHLHVWDLEQRPQPWTAGLAPLERSFRFDELLPQLDAAGVAGTVVVHTVADLDETRELVALAAAEPRVLGVVGWLDLTGDVGADLAEVRGRAGGDRLVGVRHQLQVEPDKSWLDRPEVRIGLAALGAAGLTFDLVVSPEQLPGLLGAIDAAPAAGFVLDHAGKPGLARGDLAAWRRDVADLARRPHVSAKLSGLVTEADWHTWTSADLRLAVEVLLEAFGPERVMWGSDWPVCLLADTDYARWVRTSEQLLAGLAADEQEAVWGGTARRVYGLEAA